MKGGGRMRRINAFLWVILATMGLGLFLPGCATAPGRKVETALAEALISDEQSNQIGEQVHADVEKSGVRYIQDPAVRGYVEQIAGRIFSLAKKDRPGVGYHVHVIDDPKTVNAFAAP